MKPNEVSAHHVKGYLLRTPDGELIFRIYDEKDRKKFKDYKIFHHDLQVEITDDYSSFFEYDNEKKEEEGYDGYINYPSRLLESAKKRLAEQKEKDVLPQSTEAQDKGEKQADKKPA